MAGEIPSVVPSSLTRDLDDDDSVDIQGLDDLDDTDDLDDLDDPDIEDLDDIEEETPPPRKKKEKQVAKKSENEKPKTPKASSTPKTPKAPKAEKPEKVKPAPEPADEAEPVSDIEVYTSEESAKSKEIARKFKSLACDTRISIIRILSEHGSVHVSAISRALRSSQPAISHHLALLRHAGVVTDDRVSKNVVYTLTEYGNHLSSMLTQE